MKPALPVPHQLLTTLEYRVTLVWPREIVLLGQSADIGLSWALFTGSGIAWERADEFSLGRVKKGLDSACGCWCRR
ncbi:MAG: hypothetical protein VX911_05840 [Candidatus Latescibacterota bacterium]|nr:hypothetical protein [Candidatus Latescibacterota bacterium]